VGRLVLVGGCKDERVWLLGSGVFEERLSANNRPSLNRSKSSRSPLTELCPDAVWNIFANAIVILGSTAKRMRII